MTRQQHDFDAVKLFLVDAEQRAEKRGKVAEPEPKRQKRKAITMELDGGLVDLIREMSKRMDCSPAAIVSYLLVDGLERFADGAIGFDDCFVPSRSPRYKWVVEVNVNGLRAAVKGRLGERGD